MVDKGVRWADGGEAVSWSESYLCDACTGKEEPADYCPACTAAWEKFWFRSPRQPAPTITWQEERERRRPVQRAQYARKRARILAQRGATLCAQCGGQFKRKRADARYCFDACRQRAHRKVVTASKVSTERNLK